MATRLISVLIATVLGLAACSSSGGSSGSAGGAAASSGSASASSAVSVRLVGGHLVGPDGKTLYFNTVDTAAKVQCTGECSAIWPPLLGTARAGAGLDAMHFSTVSRPDGKVQVAYYGHPLYEFGSEAPGSMNGAGMTDAGGKWLVATPAQAAAATNGPGSAASSAASSAAGSGGGGYGGY